MLDNVEGFDRDLLACHPSTKILHFNTFQFSSCIMKWCHCCKFNDVKAFCVLPTVKSAYKELIEIMRICSL